MQITSASFVKSASSWKECPEQFLPEFAFIGRSNVGKSSLINMITQRHALAKASRTPGKTKLINYFLINNSRFLVDLPGYGYAKSAITERVSWIDRTQEYFHNRPCLLHVFVLIDWSIPPQLVDIDFCSTLQDEQIAFSLIVTKIDKATQREVHQNMEALKKALRDHFPILPQMFLSSSKKSRGREKIITYMQTLTEDMCT
jgi:GTP-binding protein